MISELAQTQFHLFAVSAYYALTVPDFEIDIMFGFRLIRGRTNCRLRLETP